MLRRVLGSLAVMCLVGLAGCSSNFRVPTSTAVSIDLSLPANTTLLPGQTAQFSATVSNATNTGVIWEVDGAVGGNSQVGTISTGGLYTAPSALPSSAVRTGANAAPSSATVTITAAAAANTSAAAQATVTLISAPIVSVSPKTATLYPGGSQQFMSTVTNASDTSVIWQVNGTAGGNASIGTITSTGLYTAPASVTNATSVTVSAVSSVSSGSSDTAAVTLNSAPTIMVSPGSANVMATKTQQYTAIVSDNSAVTWEVNGTPGGNSTVGTISITGLYTAPAVIPNPATVTITASSVEDSLVGGNATATVTPLLQIVLMPNSANVQPLGQANFTATSTIPNDTLIWKVNSTTGGSATLGTITVTGPTTASYQAPDSAPAAGFVTVQAYSTNDPTIFGSATVTIGNQPPGIAVSPGSASVALADTQQFTATVSPSTLSQAVTWSVAGVVGGNSTVGTICNAGSTPACASPGLYTAPSVLPPSPNPNPVTITATSTAEPNAGTASVTIILPASVSVAVNPTTPPALASLTLGQSEAFTATVTPSNIPNVTWSISSTDLTCDPATNPNACGGTSLDPSFSDSWNIIYTAPGSIPDSLQSATVKLKATSVSDPAASGSTTITVTANPTIKVTPATGVQLALNGQQLFTATLAHVPANTAVFWKLGCMNADEGVEGPDECPSAGANPSGGDPDIDGDGPGAISPLSGTDTLTVTYTAPAHIFYSDFQSNGCPDADNVSHTYAYVPLTATMTVNGQSFSDTTCIRVNSN